MFLFDLHAGFETIKDNVTAALKQPVITDQQENNLSQSLQFIVSQEATIQVLEIKLEKLIAEIEKQNKPEPQPQFDPVPPEADDPHLDH